MPAEGNPTLRYANDGRAHTKEGPDHPCEYRKSRSQRRWTSTTPGPEPGDSPPDRQPCRRSTGMARNQMSPRPWDEDSCPNPRPSKDSTAAAPIVSSDASPIATTSPPRSRSSISRRIRKEPRPRPAPRITSPGHDLRGQARHPIRAGFLCLPEIPGSCRLSSSAGSRSCCSRRTLIENPGSNDSMDRRGGREAIVEGIWPAIADRRVVEHQRGSC